MRIAVSATLMVFLLGCQQPDADSTRYVVTIAPLQAILQEIVGDRATIVVLLQPGVSPHTYEARPSDVQAAEAAAAMFFVAETLDGWAARLPAQNRVRVLDLVPEAFQLHWDEGDGHHVAGHDTAGVSTIDPHFWSDPLTLKAMLPGLVEVLTSLDSGGAASYRENAERFALTLGALDSELKTIMSPLQHEPIVMFHPSWNYFLQRYGLDLAGLIEPAPGKESSPQYIKNTADMIRERNVKAVFTEPQLARRPAEVVAEAGGAVVYELDPLGGVPGRMTYRELLLSNARTLREALQ